MKRYLYLPFFNVQQITLLIFVSCLSLSVYESYGQAAFTTTWPLTAAQTFTTTGAGAGTVTAANQVMSSTLFIPASNPYYGVTSGPAGDGQRCSPKLNDLNDGGWVIDGGGVEGRYEEFVVNPNTGYNMTVTNISFSVGNRSRSEIKGNAYYYVAATNAGFTMGTGTVLGTALGASSTNTWNSYSYTTNINVASGNKIFVRIYPYNTGSNTTGKYFCTKNVSISGTTTTPNITNITFTTPATCLTNQFTLSWTGPSGFNSGTQTIVAFLKAGSAVTAGTPTNNIATYTANTAFSSGTVYQNDAAAYCIYKGTGTDAAGNHSGLTITGLTAGTTYHLLVYLVTGTNSYGAGVTGNGTSLTVLAEPAANLSSALTRTLQTTSSIPITWVAQTTGTDGYMLQGSATATPANPTDGVDLGTQPDLTSGTANVKVTPNTATTYTFGTGLSAGTMYYFKLNTYTNNGACINYRLASTRTIQIATLPNTVTSPSFSIDGTTGIGTVSWTAASGYNSTNNTTLVFIKSTSAVNTNTASSNPKKDPSTYTANTAFGSGSPYYFDAAAYCIYNGDANSCTVTGLTAGTTYQILILTAVSNASNTSVAAVAGVEGGGVTWSYSAYATTSTVYGGTYTWNAGNTTGAWTTATNWTPNRVTPAVTDQLIFNTGENITPASFGSETIGSITVTNNTTLNMIAVSQTLTVTNNNGLLNNDIIVNTGSTLSISTGMSIILSVNSLAGISGTLSVGNSCTYNTSASGAITTVSGTLTNFNTSITTASSNLVITSTGTYNHAFDGGTIPTAVWNTGSVCKVSGIVNATSFNGHSQVFSRFVWNCPGQAASNFVMGVNTSVMEVLDSFIVYTTGGGSLQLTSSSGQKDYTFGNYIQYSGTVSITQQTGSGGQRSITVINNFYASDSLGNTRFYIINDAVNAGAYGRLFVAKNLVMRKISTNTVTLEKVGPATNFGEVWFNGNSNQYAQFSTIAGNIDFNTAQTVAGFGVTLGSDATAYKFYLTQGTFNIASNTLTINNTVTYPSPSTGLFGGSSSSNLTLGFAGTTGTISFATGKQILKDLTQLAGNTTTLGTQLAITAGSTPGRDSLGLNAVLNTNDNLILRSDNDGTARLARLPVNGSGVAQATINGKIAVERYLPMATAASARRWRLLTAPLKSGTSSPTINEAWQEGVSNSNRTTPWLSDPRSGYGTHITRSTTYVPGDGYDQGSTNNPSIYYYDKNAPSKWNAPTSTSGVKITDNSGCYMLFARGDRSILISGTNVSAVPTTLAPKGELNLGKVTISAVPSGEYQTIGNPYASQIKLDNVKFNDTLGISKTIYIWDPKALGSSNVGKFITCSGNGSTYLYTGNTSAYDTKPGVIESSGAFMVISNGGQIEFNEADKTTESTTIGIASRPGRQPGPLGKINTLYTDMMVIKNEEPVLADGIAVSFNKNYQNSIDNLDAPKLSAFNTREDLGIRSNGHLLAIERRKEITTEDTIYLNISKLMTTAYRFNFRPVDFDNTYKAFIEDKYSKTITPIDLTTNSTFDFAISSDSASFVHDRFQIVFKRLKTEVPVAVKQSLTIFPNPVQNGIVNMQMSNMAAGEYHFRLINRLGQTVQTGRIIHQAGNAVEQFETTKGLAKGTYELQLIPADNTITTSISLLIQ